MRNTCPVLCGSCTTSTTTTTATATTTTITATSTTTGTTTTATATTTTTETFTSTTTTFFSDDCTLLGNYNQISRKRPVAKVFTAEFVLASDVRVDALWCAAMCG